VRLFVFFFKGATIIPRDKRDGFFFLEFSLLSHENRCYFPLSQKLLLFYTLAYIKKKRGTRVHCYYEG